MAEVRALSEIVQTQAAGAERVALGVRPLLGAVLLALFLFALPVGPTPRILSLLFFSALSLYSLALILLVRQGRSFAEFTLPSVIADSAGVAAFTLLCLAAPSLPAAMPALLAVWTYTLSIFFLSVLRLYPVLAMLAGSLAAGSSLAFAVAALFRFPGAAAEYLFIVPGAGILCGVVMSYTCRSFLTALRENLVTDEHQKASRRLVMTADIVAASVPNLRGLTGTLAEAAEIVSEGARNQAAAVDEVMAAVEQLQRSMESISASTEKTADTVSRTAIFSESGNAIVQRVIEEILGIHDVVEKMVAALARINDIADRTNLLALNAALEASRAGDQESGFSVVADEIRTLAEKSSEAAGEVSRWVRQVETVIFSGGESSKEAGKIFDTIRRDLGTYANFVQELAASVREQLLANREVTGAIVAIGDVVDRNLDAAGLVSRMVAELRSEMLKLEALVSEAPSRAAPTGRTLAGAASSGNGNDGSARGLSAGPGGAR
jgi:hypothetical protein